MKGRWTDIQTVASTVSSENFLDYEDKICLTGYHMSADSVGMQIITVYRITLAETVIMSA